MLVNPSVSDDSEFLIASLREFGISINRRKNGLEVVGSGGQLNIPSKELFVGNAGTAMRFLTTLAGLAHGEITLTGDEQMKRRPINELLDALRAAGIKCSSSNGCPPVKIHGGNFVGGRIDVVGSTSSQFVSSLLLSAPYAKRPVTLHVKGGISSMPYVHMSLHVMRSFGAAIDTDDLTMFHVHNDQRYIGHEFRIEADASAATYFLAAAAITNGHVVITNLSVESLQSDVRFISILGDMGCTIVKHNDSIELHGGTLRGIDIDMNEMPDCVPTLAVVAAFAEGPTIIQNIAHLQHKETNRLTALATELTKLGTKVEASDDGLVIHPQPMKGTTIETYNDHRMAMSFAVAGLKVEGIRIQNPMCVAKSFPGFWEEFKKIESKE